MAFDVWSTIFSGIIHNQKNANGSKEDCEELEHYCGDVEDAINCFWWLSLLDFCSRAELDHLVVGSDGYLFWFLLIPNPHARLFKS